MTAVEESKKNEEAYHEQYEVLQAEDKLMDKNFRREFMDVSNIIAEQLSKLFKRRPRYCLVLLDLEDL